MARKKKTLVMGAYVWDTSLDRLREFKKVHGHCNVPPNYPKDRKLGNWVHHQRRFWRNGVLGEDRTARLGALGFVWDLHQANWLRMFTRLEDYIRSNPDFGNPGRFPGEKELERWVYKQRRLYRQGRIDEERRLNLEKIGFLWEVQDAVWERMLSAFLEYQKTYGSCGVPTRWPENPALGNWVVQQRLLKKMAKLSMARISRLNAIGFMW